MKQKVKKLKEDALTATKDAKKSRKKCTQLGIVPPGESQTRELEREGRYHQVEQCLLQMETSEMQEEIDEYKLQLTQYKEEVKELRDYIEELHLQNDDLEEQLGQKDQPDIAKTKHGRQYTKEVRKLYYSLLSQNIPPNKIRGIIKSVFQHLLPSASPNELQLPSKSTAGCMRREELPTVSRAQKAAKLAATEALHINSDGTTLNQQKIAGALVNGMVLGVHTVADGSANSAFDAITTEFSKVKEVGKTSQILLKQNMEGSILRRCANCITLCYRKTYLLTKSGGSSNQCFSTCYHLLALMSYSFLVNQQQGACAVKNCQLSVVPRRQLNWLQQRLFTLTVMAPL